MADSDLDNLNDFEETITFDYIKSNFFRVIYVDGVMANLNGKGNVHLIIWNQRGPIPKQEIYSITPDGSLGDEIDSVSRNSMVREVEADIILSRESALSLKKLLEDILSEDDF